MNPTDLEDLLKTSGLLIVLEEHADSIGQGAFDLMDYPEVQAFANEVLKLRERVK
jgi:hypothetical protein